jgi:hypothetical protein
MLLPVVTPELEAATVLARYRLIYLLDKVEEIEALAGAVVVGAEQPREGEPPAVPVPELELALLLDASSAARDLAAGRPESRRRRWRAEVRDGGRADEQRVSDGRRTPGRGDRMFRWGPHQK